MVDQNGAYLFRKRGIYYYAAIKGKIDRRIFVDSCDRTLGFGLRAAGCGGTRYHYFDPPALLRDGVAAFSAAVSRRQLVL